jgi:GST-like protein
MASRDGYTLYGAQGSGSASVEAALEWSGLPYRLVEAATWEPDSALEELRRVNPLGQIPTLVLPDGTVLTESAAILIHLGLAHPQSGLLPTASSEQARAIRGLVYVAANCYAAVGIVDYPERWLADSDEPACENLRRGTRKRLAGLWDVFADSFAATPWLGGPEMGALDLYAATISKWSGARTYLKKSRPAFHELMLRVEAHPKVAPVFARHWPAAG